MTSSACLASEEFRMSGLGFCYSGDIAFCEENPAAWDPEFRAESAANNKCRPKKAERVSDFEITVLPTVYPGGQVFDVYATANFKCIDEE